jgi:hypothetical protein
MTSHPTDMRPEIAACANIAPLVRESAPQDHEGLPGGRGPGPRAAACRATSSGVRSFPTMPRIPETEIMRVLDMGRKLGGRAVRR